MQDKYKLLSGSDLKIIAVIAMLCDHTARILHGVDWATIPLFHIGHTSVSWVYIMSGIIGRIAFPIFAFLTVEGYVHTKNVNKYLGTLLIFAMLSIVPFSLRHDSLFLWRGQNVLFTLAMGIYCIRTLHHSSKQKAAFVVIAMLSLAFIFQVDYGPMGVAYIVLLWALRHNNLHQGLLTVCTFFTRKFSMPAVLAILPISLYNGKRGFITGKYSKYLFYAFYPIHLLVLHLVKTYFL